MSIAQAEKLKRDLTDKYVVVQEGVPELRRFVGLTGQVKTVNMNCRVLVQFDGAVDISWYDIDASYLKVVDAPQPKAKADSKTEAPAKKAAPAKAKPAAGKSPLEMARAQGAAGGEKKLSPLELARQQGAAGGGAAGAGGAAKAPEAKAEGGKKLSPLELARQQGAAKAGGATEETPAAEGKKLSPLEMARQQGAAKSGADEAPAEEPAAAAPEAAPEVPAEKSAGPATATPGSTAEILALARQQGAFKG
ncbi:MAG: hypothetical protein KDA80_01930 [Planctomycetaceae bacterium]|nr:hypothetical protein [Planctomycetaceae bacterium]